MKKVIYALILPLVVVSGLVFANREIKNESSKKPSPKPFSIADRKAGQENMKKWEASPDGIKFKKWEASPEGKKLHASADKIRKHITAFTNMEAVVTSLSLPLRPNGKSSGIKGIMVRINGEEYMMQFGYKDFQQLNSLKVNDKIVIRSHFAGYASFPYVLISGDYIERNGKVVFKRIFRKGGC